MKFYKEGDKSKAICECCQAIRAATFKVRDVPLSDDDAIVKGILVAVCDECGMVVGIPEQSSYKVAETINQQRKPVEARVPAHMIDILAQACLTIGADSSFIQPLIKYYIHSYSNGKFSDHAPALIENLKHELAQGPKSSRLSLKGTYVADEIAKVSEKAGFKSAADALRALIVQVDKDIIEKPNAKIIKDVRSTMAAYC